MKFLLSNSCGNTCGIDSYVAYYELDAEGYCTRSIEFRADGSVLKYTESNAADRLGQLPEGIFEESEYSKPKYGSASHITEELFNTIWAHTKGDNL